MRMTHGRLLFLFIFTSVLQIQTPAWSATDKSCPGLSTAPSQNWVLTDSDKARMVAKIVENAGEEKRFSGLEDGNAGLHAYIIPQSEVARTMTVIAGLLKRPDLFSNFSYNSAEQHMVAVLETWDEPQVSLLVFQRDSEKAIQLAHAVSPFNFHDEDTPTEDPVRQAVPTAWATGNYDGFHVFYSLLKDAEKLALPYENPTTHDWSIEDFK